MEEYKEILQRLDRQDEKLDSEETTHAGIIKRLEETTAQVEALSDRTSAFHKRHEEHIESLKPMLEWYANIVTVQRGVKLFWLTIGYIAVMVGAVSVTYLAVKGK
jgi:hypothetical protein